MNDIPPGNTDILPPGPRGTTFYCERFTSTVQVRHRISDCRNVLVAEFPLPYSAQSRQWWADLFRPAIQDYLRTYGA